MSLIHIGQRLALLTLVIFAISGCKLIESLGKPKVLTSPDGKFQLTIPAGWREDPSLREKAGIKASNRLQELYVIVISESKEDFADDMTLERFTTITSNHMISKIGSPEASPPLRTTINTNPALQYELQGVINDVKIAYLITTVETPRNFHQIITWTLRSRIDQNQSTLQKVTSSFREN